VQKPKRGVGTGRRIRGHISWAAKKTGGPGGDGGREFTRKFANCGGKKGEELRGRRTKMGGTALQNLFVKQRGAKET